MQVIKELSFLFFLISAGYILGFVQKVRVGSMVIAVEGSLIDCTCANTMHTLLRALRGRVPSENTSEKSS